MSLPVAKHDFLYGSTDGRFQVFDGRCPVGVGLCADSDAPLDGTDPGSGKDIAATFDGFGPFRDVAQRHIGNLENATFLLDRPAVAQDAEGVLLQVDEIEQAERFRQNQPLLLRFFPLLLQLGPGSGMKAAYKGKSIGFMKCPKTFPEVPQTLRHINIFRPVQGDQEKLPLFQTQFSQDSATINFFFIIVQNLKDWIAGNKDPVGIDPLPQKIGPTPLGIGHQDVATMIDDATVHFLGHSVIKASVASLHVIDGNPHTLGHDRGKGAVGIPQDEQTICFRLLQDFFALCKYSSHLFHGTFRLALQDEVRHSQAQIFEKNLIQISIEILSGMDDPMVANIVQCWNYSAEPDNFWSSSQNGDNLHLFPLQRRNSPSVRAS